MALVLLATACTATLSVPNDVNFSVGATVGHSAKQQFLAITSAQSWSITLEYVAPEGVSDWCALSKTEGEGNANVLSLIHISEPRD